MKIQWFLCFKSCACTFHLILSAHALEEAVNRELGLPCPGSDYTFAVSPQLHGFETFGFFVSLQFLGCTEFVIIPVALPIAISSLLYLFRVCGTRAAHSIQDRQTSHSYSDLIIFSLSFFVRFLVISNNFFLLVNSGLMFSQNCLLYPRDLSPEVVIITLGHIILCS